MWYHTRCSGLQTELLTEYASVAQSVEQLIRNQRVRKTE